MTPNQSKSPKINTQDIIMQWPKNYFFTIIYYKNEYFQQKQKFSVSYR